MAIALNLIDNNSPPCGRHYFWGSEMLPALALSRMAGAHSGAHRSSLSREHNNKIHFLFSSSSLLGVLAIVLFRMSYMQDARPMIKTYICILHHKNIYFNIWAFWIIDITKMIKLCPGKHNENFLRKKIILCHFDNDNLTDHIW